MNSTDEISETTLLVADHPAFVFCAYFAAFAPLAIIYALDLISEKWKTIKDTRRDGYVILFLSIPSLLFLFIYIHFQKRAEDYKEMAAATSAAIYSVLHLLRTIWGLMQLRQFKKWNTQVLLRLKWLGYDVFMSNNRFERKHCRKDCSNTTKNSFILHRDSDSSDDEQRKHFDEHSSSQDTISDEDKLPLHFSCTGLINFFNKIIRNLVRCAKSTMKSTLEEIEKVINPNAGKSSACLTCKDVDRAERTVNDEMVVNSSLIDNEFAHAELPCQLDIFSFLKDLWAMKANFWNLKLSDYMQCKLPEECTVQWIVAFLSRFGSSWLLDSRNTNTVNDLAVLAALHVTHQVSSISSGDSSETEHESVLPLSHAFAVDRREIQSSTLHMTLEVRESLPYKLRANREVKRIDFAAYESNIRDAIASWHTVAVNKLEKQEREAVTKIQPYQVAMFAKLIGGDSENRISIENITTEIVPSVAFKTFNNQLGNLNGADVSESLPFRKEFFSVLLWTGKSRNRFLLQASLHTDNWLSLESGQRQKSMLSNASEEFKTRLCTSDVFSFQQRLEKIRLQNDLATAKDISYVSSIHKTQFVGCIIETVRSLIAKWIIDRNVDLESKWLWSPQIQNDKFVFKASTQLIEEIRKVSILDNTSISMSSSENRNLNMRILWETQFALQKKVSGLVFNNTKETILPRSACLIMLFILGFPSMVVRRIWNDFYASSDSAENQQRLEETLIFDISPVEGPQPLSIQVSFFIDSGECAVEIRSAAESSDPIQFEWQIWKDSCNARLSAQSEWRERKLLSYGEDIRTEFLLSKISKPILHVDKNTIDTDFDVTIWSGWPPHLPQISHFEIAESEEIRKLEPYNRICEGSEGIVVRLERAMDNLKNNQGEKETGKSLYKQTKQFLHRGLQKQWQEHLLGCISNYGHSDALDDAMNHLFSGGSWKINELVAALHKGIVFSATHLALEEEINYKILDNYKVSEYCDQINMLSLDTGDLSIHFLKGLSLFYAVAFERGIDENCIDAFESGLFQNPVCSFYLGLSYYRMYHRYGHIEHKQLAAKYIKSYKCNGTLKTSFAYLFEKGILSGVECKRLKAMDEHVKKWYDGEVLMKLFRFLFLSSSQTGLRSAPSDDEITKHIEVESEENDSPPRIYKDFNKAARMYKSAIRMHKTTSLRDFNETQDTANPGGDASNRMGMMYHKGPDLFGDSVSADFRMLSENELILKAEKFYLEAVEMTNVDALCNLGILHAEREDEGKNEIRAYEYMERAVSMHHTIAMNNLAVMTEKEIGCKRDNEQIVELYEKAVRMGRKAIATYNLAVFLKYGDKTKRNVKRANKMFKKVLERKDLDQFPVLVEQAHKALETSIDETEEELDFATVIDEYEDSFAYVKLVN